MALILPDLKIIYLGPWKTGTTTIGECLKANQENIIKVRLMHMDVLSVHLPAKTVREHVGEKVWNSYTKVGSIRNPWDTIVSAFFYIKRKPEHCDLTFREFVEHAFNWQPRSSSNQLFENGELVVDKIIRMESFAKDVLNIFNIDINEKKYDGIRTMNAGGLRKGTTYRQMFDDDPDLIELVQLCCKLEIEKFGYVY